MSKLSFAAMSLIAAIPGGYLIFRLVMAIPHFREMVGMMRVMYGLIFLLVAVVTVLPVGIMIFVKEEKEAQPKPDETEAEDADEPAAATATEDELGRQAVVVDQTATVEFAEEFDEAEEEPEPNGKKKRKKK